MNDATSQPTVAGAAAPSWHALPAQDALARTASSADGLSREEAQQRLAQFGRNVLPAQRSPGWLAIGLRQLRSPLIYVLLAAAVVSFALGDVTDAGFIGIVLLVNSVIGGWQEWRAEQQSQSLQKLLRIRATTLRDGEMADTDAAELVPGDIVALESGQLVPADLRLLSTQGLEIAEAALTGESLAVVKDAAAVSEPDAALADRSNMAYAGSLVARGRGVGVTVATGAGTAIGRLASAMSATRSGQPPLVQRMERFSRTIAAVVLLASGLIGAVGVWVHDDSIAAMFVFAVALAVSAIPEGLPVALTVALAIAARRMALRGAIVRRLPAVEGLGSCTLIASDKTGTLTCNELTARELWLPDEARYTVSGSGYAPTGTIVGAFGEAAATAGNLHHALQVAAACNEADLYRRETSWRWRGDPTDIALLALAEKGGVSREQLLVERPQVNAIPYEPERRYAATWHALDGATWVAVKGAPERVLQMCRSASADRILQAAEDMAQRGLRVLALAGGLTAHPVTPQETPAEPQGLEFVGLIGLIDPLRPEVQDAVRRCAAAGIRVVMVTGDHPTTALAIARDLGIAARPQEVVHGSALQGASPETLELAVERGTVFARVTPEQKLALVDAAQRAGHFVAVTGDGVNDAPALRRANIGVAMGLGGTDVAREASDLVLSDDNFATIVAGVEEGRIAYQNIRNVVYLLTAAGAAEVLTVGLAVVIGLPIPLLPVQLLWLNLVTNGIQDVALAFEHGRGDELDTPPRRPDDPIFDRLMIERALFAGTWMAALGFGAFAVLLRMDMPLEQARNALLLLMVLMQNVDAFNARSETRSAFAIPLRNNRLLVLGVVGALAIHVLALYAPLMQRVLRIEPVAPVGWVALPLMALSLLAVMELHKLWWARRARAACSTMELDLPRR
ncbi:MAG: HAD-IC family P-type ATPase [Nevskiales bacterium]|nr:HAD-IC family P-type ATPase [Nevskiales bacterium]